MRLQRAEAAVVRADAARSSAVAADERAATPSNATPPPRRRRLPLPRPAPAGASAPAPLLRHLARDRRRRGGDGAPGV